MKMYNLVKFTPFIALLFLASCSGLSKKSESTETVEAKQKVRIETVELIPIEQNVSFTATVEPNLVNNISPAMGGRIRKINVDVGAYVNKGQALVQMDNTNLSQQETQLATLKRDYERYLELYQVGGISKQQLDQAKTQLDVMQTAIGNISENTILRSPISGVVTARNYDAGDVAAGLPILTVQDINPVKVKINVSESYYNKVTKGQNAKVQMDAIGEDVFEGKVSLLYPTLDQVSHTFPVEITVNNPDNKIRPGMFARVEMNFGVNDRPLLPDRAVLKQVGSNDRYVFVEKDGKAIYTLVNLGIRLDDKYEIISGLNAGDKVIVEGNNGLIDGNEVEIVK
ncbi:MAG: efflux RND transporter periplasmic adaptor subunit [Dysgonamonadaceae bacterium]|nr:efflux RND transporter periplasmic adaptor subunit [Dysgonamonadaceae bacterium]MDD3310175.1 efflux RND transporter periplasmic adaptor subunit [Dysgonamonadaceae bacterium]MDD3901301.1 efflux RND transporter periplasmic adaptor subunit [Dysgonamonadaceae bacterium]MDD4399780.1 efflux RND transporter periplasmic adaptor subunit [Dysgonamonadaceae bacterium]